ncbi:protein pitchfork [Motacilla alba alba]|uniref:protein pitchfork n=1 Tax=Motacilla alba alba TaxID=1094192 RepID=UPI0018D58F8D|nr:protein pitchfork [Motacilla alba alba]
MLAFSRSLPLLPPPVCQARMAARHDPKAGAKLISFGTTQERKMFPYGYAPDRLGIEVLGVRGSPSLGPGSYLGPESRALQPGSSRPVSTLGYAMGARTAPRFQRTAQPETPGPAAYGPFPEPRRPRPGPAPFGSSSPRFPRRIPDQERFPGPGTYDPQEPVPRGVSWPGRFGAPEPGALPRPPPRMLRMQVQKMTVDKKFQKNQGREAYLKLYHG